jgi:diguanylate cyclase (GGDEF)-like protein
MPHTAASAGAEAADRAASLMAQLQRGFSWLRFDAEFEVAYRQDQFRERVRYLRVSIAILVGLLLVLFQIDQGVMPEISGRLPLAARFGIMVPALVIGFALTFVSRAHVWYPRVMAVLAPAVLIAIAWLGLWAWSQGEPRLFARLIIGMIAVYFVLGVTLRIAFAANLAAIAAYAWLAVSVSMPAPDLVHYLCVLALSSAICAMGAYNLEHARRTAWLEGRLLEETALQDGLTGIHNRRRFDEHLQRVWHQCIREHKPLALLFADIDHFKAYNDRYGHQAGDEALKAVAGVLARHARRPMELVARYGGEEFAVVLYDTSREHAVRIGGEILEEVRALGIAHAASTAAPVLTISLGIACVMPVARRSSAGLLQLADQALYAAKDGGRNQLRTLEAEYEHMKTGYFRRQPPGDAPDQ